MLNVYNSYEQLAGGQHSASLISNTSGVGQAHPPVQSNFFIASSSGWNFSTLTSTASSDQYANYDFIASQNSLTATLVWERQFNSNPNVPLGINNLDLYLYDTSDGRLIDYSTSIVDNVQDVYDTNLISGDSYDLEVLKVGGTAGVSPGVISNTETYALAYNFAAAQSGAITQPGVWNAAAGGSWSAAGSWYDSTIPQQAHATANFTNAISAPQTVTLDGNWTVGHVNFLSANPYTIAAGNGGTLVLDNTGTDETASVVDSGGGQFITAPVVLNDDTEVTVVNAADTLTFSGGISGVANLYTAGAGTVTLAAPDSYTTGTTVESGTLQITSYLALPAGRSVVNNGTLSIQSGTSAQPAIIGTLTGSGTLIVGGNPGAAYLRLQAGSGTCSLGALMINTNYTLDITDNILDINYPAGDDPVATIRGYLQTGYGKDTWTGPGIDSSTAAANPGQFAIGYADGNTDVNTPAQPNQILIETTIAGDANLDGIVNFSDLLVVAQDFGRTGQDWAQGDFNYDGIVNFSDLLLVAQNFGKQLTAGELAQLPGSFESEWLLAQNEITNSSVPEPGSIGLLAIGATLLARRRRNPTTT